MPARLALVLLVSLAASAPAWSQPKALPVEGMTEAQRADYRKLLHGYLETFRVLGREVDPTPPAPMPCDVVVYMRDMRLPELPASLMLRGD